MIERKSIWIIAFLVPVCSLLFAEGLIVYITKTSEKYHTSTCSYIKKSKIPISLSNAIRQGYTPCSRCNPPTLLPIQTPGPASQTPDEAPAVSASVEELALPYCDDPSAVQYYTGFALLYSEEHEQPYWVAYLLTDDEVLGPIERSDNFRENPHIPTGSASLEDYRGSGYDRCHIAPATDMKWSEEAMRDSFFMSNISPQRPGFNRGIWLKFEDWVRDQAEANEEVYVVTGPIIADGPYEEFCIIIHFGKRNLPLVKTCQLWEKRG